MNKPKIKQGYAYVLADHPLKPSEDNLPSPMYNVPNPGSDIAPEVSAEDIEGAIRKFQKATAEQIQEAQCKTAQKQ